MKKAPILVPLALLALCAGSWFWYSARSDVDTAAPGSPGRDADSDAFPAPTSDATPSPSAPRATPGPGRAPDSSSDATLHAAQTIAPTGAGAPEVARDATPAADPLLRKVGAARSRAESDAEPVLVPAGWQYEWADDAGTFDLVSDAEVAWQGRSARITSRRAVPERPWPGISQLFQAVDANAFDGSTVEFSISMKLQEPSRVFVWARADNAEGLEVALARTSLADSPRGTRDWAIYSVELAIPREAVRIVFGVLVDNPANVWLDEARLDVTGDKAKRGDRTRRTNSYGAHNPKVVFPQPFNLNFDSTVVRENEVEAPPPP